MSGGSVNAVFYADKYHPIQAGSIDGTDVAPHDNAVLRALICSQAGLYDPFGDPKATGDPYCTVVVGLLSRQTDEETLRKAMTRYGKVKSMRLVRDIVTGASRGYAFVEYETDREMRHSCEDAHHSIIDGSEVIVDYYRQQLMPGWKPRRLGGGLGGKKESGQLRFGGRERPFRAPLRPIPYDELKKLGIPPPPEGRYMTRFQVPPPPRRKSSNINKEDSPPRRRSRDRVDDSSHKRQRSPTEDDGYRRKSSRDRREESQSRRSERSSSTREETRFNRQRKWMAMVIASGEEAVNQAKYLQPRRMVAIKEKKLQLKPSAALIGTITTGITGSTRMRAATISTGTAGITGTMVTPRGVRVEITAARARAAYTNINPCFDE